MLHTLASRVSETRPQPRCGRAASRSSNASRLARRGAALAWTLALGLAAGLGSCGSDGNAGSGPRGSGDAGAGDAEILNLRYGRLVDVFGYRPGGGQVVELFQTDVIIGLEISDDRPVGSTKPDSEVDYDFIGTNPDTLQPRLLIPRDVGSDDFNTLLGRARDSLRLVAPGISGQDTALVPFSVVPRNAALEVEFDADLNIDDSFFLEYDDQGMAVGPLNNEAVQLLEIVGDPNDANPEGDYRVIPIRSIPRGNRLIIDPVLLGSEGIFYQVRNNASGMPAAPDQIGANIRIAIAVEGPLAMPEASVDPTSPYSGLNNRGDLSAVRDFRSATANDASADIGNGFVADSEPPRMLGELLMFLERVNPINSGPQAGAQELTVYKGGKLHDIDVGDVFRIFDPSSNQLVGSSEVIVEPEDDLGDPSVQHVRVIIRAIDNLEAIDPSNQPDYPSNPQSMEGEAWLRRNAPSSVLVTEFTRSRRIDGVIVRDDPSNFISFSPTPLPLDNGEPSPSTENVSPFAEAIVRFTKPVDLDSALAFSTFFFSAKDVLGPTAITDSVETYLGGINIDDDRVDPAKLKTPHLIAARVLDQDGSQSTLRLQPTRGFYLDDFMRQVYADFQADPNSPDGDPARFDYWVNLVGGLEGVRDLSGNALDFQDQANESADFISIPFGLDLRRNDQGDPLFADNIAVSIIRDFASEDEDEQPSIYLQGEVPQLDPNGDPIQVGVDGLANADVFGGVTVEDGRLKARPTTRVSRWVDDLNQISAPPQSSPLRFCPERLDGNELISAETARAAFGQGIQNPLNPFGSRLQTVWREIDMSLSRTDPFDFNLDVEQLYWSPFQGTAITFDIFDRVSLFLGHSEYRPEPCIGSFSSQPELPNSGVRSLFEDNYAHNLTPGNSNLKSLDPAPHPAYVDRQLTIDAAMAFTEPNGINRYLPLPEFQRPYFVWRDETVEVQGGVSGEGSDVRNNSQRMPAYVLSPFHGGLGNNSIVRPITFEVERSQTAWGNFTEFQLGNKTRNELFTGGGLGTPALPLLADFWTYCDDPDLPTGNGFIATGFNGWQIAITVQSSPQPNFRAFSGGFAGSDTRPSICIDTASAGWNRAQGGYTPDGQRTGAALDNSLYWIAADFLKRTTVTTFGFVDIYNPHRMPAQADIAQNLWDPRLGPYFSDVNGVPQPTSDRAPAFDYAFEPALPNNGTSVVPEFRGATELDKHASPWEHPWRFNEQANFAGWQTEQAPSEQNFPLKPLIAGDAYIKKYDDRTIFNPVGQPRNYWAFQYNKQVTDYTSEITDLSSNSFLGQFVGPTEVFTTQQLRYFNWRFLMVNNVDSTPAVSPEVEAFAVTYRFERR